MKPRNINLLLGKTDEVQESAFWSIEDQEKNALKELGINVVTFGSPKADILIDSFQHTFKTLEARLLAMQFKPDLAILVSVGYGFILQGIEDAPFPTALLLLEWFLRAHNLHQLSSRVDRLFAVLESSIPPVERLTGKKPLSTSLPLLGDHIPAFRPLPHVEKRYDVAYIGNCNPDVHPERTRFFQRMALLPEKYKVIIGQTRNPENNNVFLFEQTNLLNNQSKICLNFSQPHMKATGTRVAHTLFSGAFLLTEPMLDEADFLEQGVHCEFYEQHNFEEKIAYYLEHEQEREMIARQGHQHAIEGAFSFSKILKKMIDKLSLPIERNRSFTQLTESEKFSHFGTHAIFTKDLTLDRGLSAAIQFFEKAYQLDPKSAQACNDLGAMYAVYFLFGANLTPQEKEHFRLQATERFKQARQNRNHDVISLFNEACFYRQANLKQEYYKKFAEIVETLNCSDEKLPKRFPHLGMMLIYFYDFYSIKKWEELFCQHFEHGKPTLRFYQAAKRYVLWKANEWMAELMLEQNYYVETEEHYREACAQMPDADTTLYQLGLFLARTGKYNDARNCYEKSLAINCLNSHSAHGLCELLLAIGNPHDAYLLASKFRLICERITVFQPSYDTFKELESRAKQSSLTGTHPT